MKNKVSFLFASIIILSGCSITIGEPAKDNNAKQEDKSENNDTNNENNKQSTPNIDILSQDFSDNYMNANHVTGYKGLIKNMNKKNIKIHRHLLVVPYARSGRAVGLLATFSSLCL